MGTWGTANAVATLAGVLVAVLIGKFSDRRSKFNAFKWAVIVSFFGMVVLSFAVKYFVEYVLISYVFTHAVFVLSLSLSDSVLPHVSTKENSYEYSGFAWGFGYLGGIAALIVAVILQKLTGDDYSPTVFLSTAIFYIIFSVYSLNGLKNVQLNEQLPVVKKNTISKLDKFLLFCGYWLISEGITVIMLFLAMYLSTEFGFSNFKIGMAVLFAQLIGFPATWYGGYLTRKFSSLSLLAVTILCWGVCIGFLLINAGTIGLAIIIISGALAIGNSQSYLRAQYSGIIEKSESGFQFGLFSIVSEAAVLGGPIIYGYGSDYFHSQKIPLAILYITMVVGFFLVKRVIRAAQ